MIAEQMCKPEAGRLAIETPKGTPPLLKSAKSEGAEHE